VTDSSDNTTAEAIRLVEADLDRTERFIQGVVGSGFTVRGWAITVGLALIGVAFDRDQWELASLAVGVALMFGLVDAYHSWIYTKALDHAQATENVLNSYFVSLTRGIDEPKSVEDFGVELEAFRPGLSANLERFRLSALKSVRPRLVILTVYGALICIAVIASVAIALKSTSKSPRVANCVIHRPDKQMLRMRCTLP
jgi:hypothetical protein